MYIFIALVIGIFIGVIISRRKPVGNLRVDRSDPSDAPYLFLELSQSVESILRKKYVTLRIRAEDFVSHE